MLPSIVELLIVVLESPLGGNGGNRTAQQPLVQRLKQCEQQYRSGTVAPWQPQPIVLHT